jgi:hypothetical protein
MYNIDAATTRTTASGPFAALRADTPIDTSAPPKRRYGQPDIPTAASQISREEQNSNR